MKQNPTDHLKLVHKVVNALLIRNPQLYYIREDLVSEGYLTLCEVCKEFVEREVKFSTYAVRQLQNRLVNYVYRNEYRFQRLAKLEDLSTPEDDSGVAMSWEEIVPGTLIDIPRTLSGLPQYLKEFFEVFSTCGIREGRKKLGIGTKRYYELKQELMDYLDDQPNI